MEVRQEAEAISDQSNYLTHPQENIAFVGSEQAANTIRVAADTE